MGRKIELLLNDAIYNAGILGFLKVCEHGGLYVEKVGATISFDRDILENFTEHYFDTLIDVFGDDTVYHELLNRYEKISSNKDIEGYTKIFDDEFKYIKEKMQRNSYIAAFAIIKARGETYDFAGVIKQIKNESDYEIKFTLLAELMQKVASYSDVFMLKDIAYTKVQPFWNGVGFLHKTANKTEFKETFTKGFLQKIIDFEPLDPKKKGINCIQCDVKMNQTTGFGISWINDLGIDAGKKHNHYWNFNVDSFICPICALVYACIPLGFTMKGSEGIFINQNKGIKSMSNANSIPLLKNTEQKSDLYYTVLDGFIQNIQEQNAKNEIENIQVIRRTENMYTFNILSRDKLKVFYECKKNFANLLGKFYQLNGEYVNIYRDVLNRVMDGRNFYPLIHIILYEGIKNGKPLWTVKDIINIQVNLFKKGDVAMN
ncbi:MAG: type I-B CRISPR-associated protein Cas8b1/Cst1, partial [Clostridia bacterium]|nr:type I-B CRISPR-associated protein Cas8b1/Cst1 [Clostridia bacterium]